MLPHIKFENDHFFNRGVKMALTLQQRVNLSKGNNDLALSVTFMEKCEQSIRKAAQEILDGTIATTHTCFNGHPVTQTQMIEWALRALTGSMDTYMKPMVMDASTLPSDPNVATDIQINNAVRYSLWPYIQQIGVSGVF